MNEIKEVFLLNDFTKFDPGDKQLFNILFLLNRFLKEGLFGTFSSFLSFPL